MTEYDKTTDPMRVCEETVRAEVERRIAAETEFDLVKQGDFSEGGGSYFHHASVQCALYRKDAPIRSRPFNVSEVVLRVDNAGQVEGLLIQRSTYDLTEREAVELL